MWDSKHLLNTKAGALDLFLCRNVNAFGSQERDKSSPASENPPHSTVVGFVDSSSWNVGDKILSLV
jgi:hypothetical protein